MFSMKMCQKRPGQRARQAQNRIRRNHPYGLMNQPAAVAPNYMGQPSMQRLPSEPRHWIPAPSTGDGHVANYTGRPDYFEPRPQCSATEATAEKWREMNKISTPTTFLLVEGKPRARRRTCFSQAAANILAEESHEETIYVADPRNWIYILCAPSRTLLLVGREVESGFYGGFRRMKIKYDSDGRMQPFL